MGVKEFLDEQLQMRRDAKKVGKLKRPTDAELWAYQFQLYVQSGSMGNFGKRGPEIKNV